MSTAGPKLMTAVQTGASRSNYARWLLFLLVLSASTMLFLSGNVHAPVQRDGSHFVFMANNIAHGQPPYWASFETKNPLTEYYWAVFIRLLHDHLSVVRAARVAEHLWILAGSLIVAILATRIVPRASDRSNSREERLARWLLGLGCGLTTLSLSLHWVVTDDGFNIASYQLVPEGISILLMLSLVERATTAKAVLLGIALFAGWAVKQTSIITMLFPLAATLIGATDRRLLARRLLSSGAVAVLLLAGFVLSLKMNGTFDNYAFSAIQYKRLIAAHFEWDSLWSDFVWNLRGFPRSPLFFYHVVFILFAPVAVVAGLISRKWQDVTFWVILAWYAGCIAQAFASLLFYRHYFLACIGPGILTFAFILGRFKVARWLVVAGFAVLAARLHLDYVHSAGFHKERYTYAPMTRTVAELRSIVPPDATVFTWGGLLHYHVETGKPSDYPQNMWWRFIVRGLPPEERDRMLRDILHTHPPDYVLEMMETYPPSNCLEPIRLDPDLLRRWTHCEYSVAGEIPAKDGRYGCPVRVFRRAAATTTQSG